MKIVYSLGDIIGSENYSHECSKEILENGIINILENVREYVIFRVDSFDYLKAHNIERYNNVA